MKVTRRTLLGTIAAGFAAGPHLPASAEGDRPSRIVRLVSPYGAGGASDISLRILAEQFGRSLNQQFIVENKPGAGTRVANELVSRAAPDGYTFLYAAAPFATAEALFEKLNYNRKDLQPVEMAMLAPLFLVVNAQAPFKTVQEMIAYGKSKPEELTFGSPGAGSQPHLAAELLFKDAGVKGLIVPFRGDNMAYTELLASRLDATLTALATALPHPERRVTRVGRGLGRAQRDLSGSHDPARAGARQRRRVRLVRFYGAGRDAAADRRSPAGGNHSRARRSRGEAEADRAGTGSETRHSRRVRQVHRR